MGGYGGYYKGEKKKVKRDTLEKRAEHMSRVQAVPQVEIIRKGKDKK